MKKIFVTRSSMPPYDEYIDAIRSLWDTHWLTNMGIYHQQLESKLKEYLNVPNLSLMVNGHMALELTIQSFGFPEGSEIITTPFTFISTTHAIVRNRLKPIFCDVNPDDGTIDENKIEDLITENTVAIIPVHVYGNICNIEAIQSNVTAKMITECILSAQKHDGAIPVLPMKDTVYLSENGSTISSLIPREKLYAGQAPEAFKLGKYYAANERLLPDEIKKTNGSTEPAVMYDMDIAMIKGDENNFKITTPADLERFKEMVIK